MSLDRGTGGSHAEKDQHPDRIQRPQTLPVLTHEREAALDAGTETHATFSVQEEVRHRQGIECLRQQDGLLWSVY